VEKERRKMIEEPFKDLVEYREWERERDPDITRGRMIKSSAAPKGRGRTNQDELGVSAPIQNLENESCLIDVLSIANGRRVFIVKSNPFLSPKNLP